MPFQFSWWFPLLCQNFHLIQSHLCIFLLLPLFLIPYQKKKKKSLPISKSRTFFLYSPKSFKVIFKNLINFELIFVSGPILLFGMYISSFTNTIYQNDYIFPMCVPAWKYCVSFYLVSVFCFTGLYVYSYASTILFLLRIWWKKLRKTLKLIQLCKV